MRIILYTVLLAWIAQSCNDESTLKIVPESKIQASSKRWIENELNLHQYAHYKHMLEASGRDEECVMTISREQLKERKDLFFKISELCDSVDIVIPPGGTVTSAQLYSDDSNTKEMIASSPSFSIGEHDSNYFSIPSTLKGRFFLSYGSCHWGSELWINFE